MDLAELRESIALTRDQIYVNTGFNGPSPTPVLERMKAALDLEAKAGPASPAGRALAREAGDDAIAAIARLLNADPEEITITHGTTEGVHVVMHGYQWQPGDELVTCNLEHSAIATPSSVLAERHGVDVKRVELASDASAGEIIEAFAGAITPKTKMVAISHVQYTCGLRLPIGSLTRMAHDNGAMILVDGAQTGGAIKLDMKALGVDFYAISGQKWLCGPQGTGALYVKQDHWRTLDPLFTTHTIADSRSGPVAETAGPARPLGRYRVTSHNTALLAGLAEAANLLQSVGLEKIEAHSLFLADRLKRQAASINGMTQTCATDDEVSTGLVSLAVGDGPQSEVVEELWTRFKIACRAVNNPPAIRVSLAGFNTVEEVDKICEALEAIASGS